MKTQNNKISLIFALVVSLAGFNKSKADSEGIVFAGGVVLGGIVLYNLIQSGVFDKSEAQVIDDAYKNVQSGIKYSEISVLEEYYIISKFSDFEKRTVINQIKEGILYQLSKGVFRYSDTSCYLDNLNLVIKNLKKSKKEVQNALKKTNARTYDLNSLVESIDNILPKIEFLYAYIENHKSYFRLCKIIKDIDQIFEKELSLLSSQKVSYSEFKWIIRNEGNKINAKYPFINYVKRLTQNIDQLNKSLANSTFKYPNLLHYANDIKNKLSSILDNVLADPDYSKENVDIENEKIKKAELELKEKEFKLKQQMEYEKLALKQRELEAREREVAAKEKEAKLREYEFQLKFHEQQNKR